MAIPITIPRLGWNMEVGVFGGWLKPDGAAIRAGESLFSLESEKATEDIECLDAGILRIAPSGPRQGDTIPVGTVIGYLVRDGETIPLEKEKANAGVAAVVTRSVTTTLPKSERLAISPRAKRVAHELGIDWTKLHGTGRTGRIRERDVRAATSSPTRRTIAERMLASHRSTAPVTLTTTADASHLVKLRSQLGDPKPSYTDLFVKLAAMALQKHSHLNARWEDERIVLAVGIHIGIAVDTDAGLLVPVVRDVPSLDLTQLAERSRDLIERARQRKLTADEMRGGTFTVTNLGAFGIDAFTPIIHVPECAVLGVGRIQRRPVVIGEQIVIRDQVTLSLTFDHRIVDGAPAARFLQTLTELIEDAGSL